mmetsp:Transcript_10836/g.21255  ORF Transcript_10836/g.21255 Transcript_10836/m.21255 type:complete len:249 (-) Transcript_10836:1165-1911(-)
MVLRKRAGMMISVSMLGLGRGAATPSRTVKGSIPAAWVLAAGVLEKARAWPGGFMILRTSVRRPVMAAAAAMAGLTKWVRPRGPWRPSKLRLLVEAQRSPGSSWSAFIPRHMEQPASRKSNPASRKILSRPSSIAICLTRPEPGTIIACLMLSATFLPLTTSATARRSSIRPLVQDPTKILSTWTPSSGVLASRPMYSRARFMALRLSSVSADSGSGTIPWMGATISGLVPQVTWGAISAASITISLS